ncbi:MAG TPA: NAD(P)-dependent oxidoreductase [Rhodopila sp.]|nr:NAD(P)-dependent oxidoreductase [Rhodopila sp.]
MTRQAGEARVIVATHRIFPESRTALTALGTLIAPEAGAEALTHAEMAAAMPRAAAMLAFMPDRVDDTFLATAPNLRIVAGALKGYDNFDVAACARRGVWLSIVPDLLTVPTAELAIGLLIGLGRHIRAGDAHVRSADFRGWRPAFYGRGLAGETAGLIGFGAIGRAIAARLRAFGMTLLCCDATPVPDAVTAEYGVTPLPFEAVLAKADYLIVAAPLLPGTHHLIGADALKHVKSGALLVNPARGSVVDEAAVAAALAAGQLGGYAADVFEMEDWHLPDRPRGIARELLDHPATLFTPHLGSAVWQARQAIEARAAANIADVLAGRPPRDAVASPSA